MRGGSQGTELISFILIVHRVDGDRLKSTDIYIRRGGGVEVSVLLVYCAGIGELSGVTIVLLCILSCRLTDMVEVLCTAVKSM